MRKKLLKFTSAVVSAVTLMSPFNIMALCADEKEEDVKEQETTFNTNAVEYDYSSRVTGDLSFEYGTTPDDSKVIHSVAEYYNYSNGGKLNIHSSGDVLLPESVDNSQSEFFPAIGNQGGIGACVAFAQTYYQYTYMVN